MATECIHVWGNWERMLWYTPAGRFVGEARKCVQCPVVETRNVEVDQRPAVIQPTIGLFAGIFNYKGKLLVRRRSLDIKSSPGEWELPGGGVDAVNASRALDERIVHEELNREVGEEVGLQLHPLIIPPGPMFPAILKGGGDWAFVIPFSIYTYGGTLKGETRWLSPDELEELAKGPERNRVVSGYGKRMHRLCLYAFLDCSARPGFACQGYRALATQMLYGIEKEWGK